MAIEQVPTTVDPRYASQSYETKLSRLVAVGLTAVDTPTLAPRLELASAMTQVDDLTWDVTVRDDARFSDGTPVTAADVAGTYALVLDPDSDSVYAKNFQERFSSVEPLDQRTARFHLKGKLATFASDLEFGIIAVDRGKPRGGRVVGAGPYRLVSLDSRQATLVANPRYHGGAPATPRLVLKFVRDNAARVLMLVAGSADLLQNSVRVDLVADLDARRNVEVQAAPSAILTYLLINNEDPVLRDVRVRQALAYAIDREAIIEAAYGGYAKLATGLLAPFHWAYHGEVDRYAYDPARAAALLDEAGLRDPDGDGPRPRVALVYKTSSDGFRVTVARIIAAQLARVGIAVEVRSFEFATFFADVKKGNYQIATLQTDIAEPDYHYTFFHSERIPNEKQPDANNRWRYRNPTVDRLSAAGRSETDPAARKAIYAELQAIIAREVPIVPLWHEDNVVLHHSEVEGYRIAPNARLGGLVGVSKRPPGGP